MQICHMAFEPWELCVRLVQDKPEPGKRLALTGLFVRQQRSHVAISTTLHLLDNASFNSGSLSPAASLLVQDPGSTSDRFKRHFNELTKFTISREEASNAGHQIL